MAEKLWGGRFQQAPAADFERWSASFAFDRRLAAAEVEGTRAHARGLRRAGILDDAECTALLAALDRLAVEASELNGPAVKESDVEDVHTWAAQRLLALAGPAAAKLQTGRSRNEQVALDLRLYLRSERAPLESALWALIASLAAFADRHAAVLIPGYTHLQRAQPVSLGHHTLAYAEMLLRDAARLADSYARADVSPLGSGALAGVPFAVDREAEARELGFAAVSANSLDAVSDRDFAIELVFALNLLGLHLSRWAEDWILYSSAEFGWLRLPDAYATGSSLMPQKRNPDALELIRGKSARQAANLQRLQWLIKSLPLAYNRDLQEDKEAVFDAVDTALGCLRIAIGVVAGAGVDESRAAAAVADAALLATDLADLLVEAGTPFAEAHHAVGRLFSEVADFRSLDAGALRQRFPRVDPQKILALSPAASVARRRFTGGTAVEQVRRQSAAIAARAAAIR